MTWNLTTALSCSPYKAAMKQRDGIWITAVRAEDYNIIVTEMQPGSREEREGLLPSVLAVIIRYGADGWQPIK